MWKEGDISKVNPVQVNSVFCSFFFVTVTLRNTPNHLQHLDFTIFQKSTLSEYGLML